MKKQTQNLLIVFALVGLFLLGNQLGFFAISNECGSFSGEGTVYYYGNINGQYLISQQSGYRDVEDKRFTSRDLSVVVASVDSFNMNKYYNPSPSIEWAKCTVGGYTPSRCANPWSSCSDVPISEIEAVRESLAQNTIISIFRLENNDCLPVSLKAKDVMENDFITIEECEKNILRNFYRLGDKECTLVFESELEKLSTDYLDLQSCNKELLLSLELSGEEISRLLDILSSIDDIDKQAEKILQLSLSLEERNQLIDELNLDIIEQEELLEKIKILEEKLSQEDKSTPSYLNFWQDYKIVIIIIGVLLGLILIGGRRR